MELAASVKDAEEGVHKRKELARRIAEDNAELRKMDINAEAQLVAESKEAEAARKPEMARRRRKKPPRVGSASTTRGTP